MPGDYHNQLKSKQTKKESLRLGDFLKKKKKKTKTKKGKKDEANKITKPKRAKRSQVRFYFIFSRYHKEACVRIDNYLISLEV